MITANSNENFLSIGHRPLRHDGVDKVTGKAKYGSDVEFSGMLHGKILRSPHAHAEIENIDYSKAIQHPEFKALVFHKDLLISGDNFNPYKKEGFCSVDKKSLVTQDLSDSTISEIYKTILYLCFAKNLL